MSAMCDQKLTYTTHVLLLAFRGSHLASRIQQLHDVLRNKLHWKTSLYWIDGPDSGTAQQRLDNIAYALTSNLQHAEEHLIVYYGGYASTPEDELGDKWTSHCVMTWHASPPDGSTMSCDSCSLYVKPDALLRLLLSYPNDLLFLTDSCEDIRRNQFPAWMEQMVHNPDSRSKNVHIIDTGGKSKVSKVTIAKDAAVEICVKCKEGSMRWSFQPADSPGSGTEILTKNFTGFADRGEEHKKGMSSVVVGRSDILVGGEHTSTVLGKTLALPCPRTSPEVQQPVDVLPQYTAANVLLVRWDLDDEHNSEDVFCLGAIREAFGGYLHWQVEELQIPQDLGLNDEWLGHGGFVGKEVQDFVSKYGQAGNLVVIYYVGHGTSVWSNRSPNHLQALKSTDRDSPRFDLSHLQALLRDRCHADVLLVLDCCSAGFLPACLDPTLRSYVNRPNHIMETLAACPSKSSTPQKGEHSFSRRLAGQLTLHAGQPGGISVDRLNTLMVHDWRYRDASPNGDESKTQSKENVRILNCGDRSIVLQPLAQQTEEARQQEAEEHGKRRGQGMERGERMDRGQEMERGEEKERFENKAQ